jgi:DNA-binding protein, ybaB/ebfC family
MGGFGGMNINSLMKEAKKMQADLEKNQQELAEKEFEASAGGNAVSVKVNGQKQILDLKLQKEVVDPEDVEMLQDLIVTCINQAFKQVDDAQAASMGKFNIPGIM